MTCTKILFSAMFSLLVLVGATSVCHAEAELAPMDTQALASTSGGAEAVVFSTVTGNVIGNVGNTGNVSNVSATNNSGLTTMIVNTGNQVSIATATAVTINYH